MSVTVRNIAFGRPLVILSLFRTVLGNFVTENFVTENFNSDNFDTENSPFEISMRVIFTALIFHRAEFSSSIILIFVSEINTVIPFSLENIKLEN